jgi:phenylpropionate dioxygenase-like ring-hydroxylating dioxygenase large terminal subunit
VETWQGLVFCNLSKEARSLSDELSELAPLVEPFKLHEMRTRRDWFEPIDCNWKTYVEKHGGICVCC